MSSTQISISSTGISGSLQRLATGETYLVAGQGVSIVTGSNGQVRISSSVNNSSGLYGNGAHGAGTIDASGSYSWASKTGNTFQLLTDVYLSDLDIKPGFTLKTGNFKIFVSGSTRVSGTLDNSSGNQIATVGGSLRRGAGSSLFQAGDPGDMGGAGGNGFYPGGSVTGKGPRYVPGVIDQLIYDGTTGTFTMGVAGAAGGAGPGGEYGGAGGGFIVLVSKTINVHSSGTISANGGPGVEGGGGGGGCIILISQTPVVNAGSITVNGGTSVSGSNGQPGQIIQFIVS